MKNIFLVRHCQAEGQEAEAPLTAAGVLQSQQLADFFADKSIDYILSSPYERAQRTAAPLARRLGLEIELDNRLIERVLTGESQDDWRSMLRKTYEDLDLCYEGGESSRAAMSRAAAVIEEVRRTGCENAVIVSHGNLISLLLKHYDDRIGYREWEALTNPDVYGLSFTNDIPGIQRMWME